MPIQRVTLETLSGQLRDRWESVPFWTSEEARLALNEALRTWNMFTGTWSRKVILGATLLDPWVGVPGALLYTTRVSHLERPLDASSLFDLDHARPNWEAETTASGGTVPRIPRKWAPAGVDLFVIWPAIHYNRATLVVDGVADTPQLVSSTDYVDLEDSEHQALLGEALHIAAFKEGGTRWEGTFHYHREFVAAAADRNARIRSSSFFRRYLGLDFQRSQQKIREEAVSAVSA